MKGDCDKCGGTINPDDLRFCRACKDRDDEEINRLRERVEELLNEIEGLK